MHKDDYIKIAREYESKGRRVLARELGITESYLSNIVKKLRGQGIPIKLKTQKEKHALAEAVKELKKEIIVA